MCFKENKTTCNNQENISEVKEEPKVESMAMTECTSVQACVKDEQPQVNPDMCGFCEKKLGINRFTCKCGLN
jgi:hypothetical protein